MKLIRTLSCTDPALWIEFRSDFSPIRCFGFQPKYDDKASSPRKEVLQKMTSFDCTVVGTCLYDCEAALRLVCGLCVVCHCSLHRSRSSFHEMCGRLRLMSLIAELR
jgi:hypothetical protein